MTNKPDNDKQPTIRDEREPYAEPTLDEEELFEVLALSCGKVDFHIRQCAGNPKMS